MQPTSISGETVRDILELISYPRHFSYPKLVDELRCNHVARARLVNGVSVSLTVIRPIANR
jgi:hypothetical protein